MFIFNLWQESEVYHNFTIEFKASDLQPRWQQRISSICDRSQKCIITLLLKKMMESLWSQIKVAAAYTLNLWQESEMYSHYTIEFKAFNLQSRWLQRIPSICDRGQKCTIILPLNLKPQISNQGWCNSKGSKWSLFQSKEVNILPIEIRKDRIFMMSVFPWCPNFDLLKGNKDLE
jgi:hypothetical protein